MKSFISPISLFLTYVLLSTLYIKKIFSSLASLFLIGWQGRCRNCGLARQVKKWGKIKTTHSMWFFFLFLSYLSFPQPPDTAPRSSGSSSRSRATRWILLLLQKNQHLNVSDVIFSPIKKNCHNPDQTTIVNSGTERPRCRSWACGWNWGEPLLLCYWTNCCLLDWHRLCINCVDYIC